jgi:O-methyltransferase domain/Dimerisation domain
MSPLDSTPSTAMMPPQVAFMQMINGYWVSQSIYVAAKLGIADRLIDGPKHCEVLATETGANSHSIYRLLRGLASIGIFSETEPHCFALTPLAQFLRSDGPDSLHAVAVMSGEEHYRAWGDLLYSVKTGENAFEHVYGMPIFPYYSQNPEPAQIFDRAMTGYSSTEIEAVVASYDFSTIHTLVDVGGGHGSLLISILQANPYLRGILFDQGTVLEGAPPLIEAEGVTDRCNLAAGNFFESVPMGGDAYILKHIVHDWGDEKAIAILKRCREVMPETGKLLIVEQVIPPGNEPFMGKFLDLNMLVMCPGGCERTEAEYQSLLAQAGFQLTKIVPTQTFASVIEGVPI